MRFLAEIQRLPSRKSRNGNPQSWALYHCAACNRLVERLVSNAQRNRSCGCIERVRGHSKSGSEIYNLWAGMKARCYCKGADNYEFYGGRGIKICSEWHKDYEAFERWALNHGYAKELTIDRIDNHGDYSPSNCRFVSHAENMRNSRVAKLTIDEVEVIRKLHSMGNYTLKQLAARFSVSFSTISSITRYETWK